MTNLIGILDGKTKGETKLSQNSFKLIKRERCHCPCHKSIMGIQLYGCEWTNSRCFIPKESTPAPSKSLGGPHSQSGHFGEEKNLLPLP